MRISSGIALLAASAVLGACATVGNKTAEHRPDRCIEAAGAGTGESSRDARAMAEADISRQVSDVRGYLLSQGMRRIRPRGTSISCKPFPFGGGLTQCTLVRRFCGR
jgi:hypothetical protein